MDTQIARPEILATIANCSPYLKNLCDNYPNYVARIFAEQPETLLRDLCANLGQTDDIAVHLRFRKSQAALLIGLADLAGLWDVTEVTHALTTFADACLVAATNHLLREAATQGKLKLINEANPSLGCGYTILAMGKHGAFELNYSSDIDLIILYDPQIAPLSAGVEPSTFFVKLTRNLVALLQNITADGYVFRVDLRLRPDPRATQIAVSSEAAAIYYENQGQNWERAAMIKARAVAGDVALGEEFLDRLTSYIWRKYLDYAAIADVQALKRQIHAVKGHSEIAVQGHDLKLGRGGIREIEFFVQTQQLIAGGRNKALRGRRTLDMLDALANAKWVTLETAAELKDCYNFLRTLEHRAQMVDDQQTHIVPATSDAFERYAQFCGFNSGDALSKKLRATLQTVQKHYAALFEDAGNLAGDTGSLVFTGGEDDPATLVTLKNLGFAQGSDISAIIRSWHFGRYAAMRTARAREMLTELMPKLLQTLAQNGDADQTFLAFDNFLKELPAGVQLFSMIKANPNLLDLVAQILGSAPRMAEQLSRYPRTLEAVIAPGFFEYLPRAEDLRAELGDLIPRETPRDQAMDRTRIFAREHMFRIGVRILSETISAEEAGQAYSRIAGEVLHKLLEVIEVEMAQSHGFIKDGQCAILAMGKLGSREMTATSDLDLILIYDHAKDAEISDGPKPLSAQQYFARLAQRLVTTLTAPTAEGTLYDVDLRLRPSGNKGPVAVSLQSFASYQLNEAWTWERMALTRARVIAGNADLTKKIEAIICQTLCAKRDPEKTRTDVKDMRALMLREQKSIGTWDIKRHRGGQIEVEFIAQTLQLLHAAKAPEILHTNTEETLRSAQQLGLLETKDANVLLNASGLYQRLTQLIRLSLVRDYDPKLVNAKFNTAVSRVAAQPDIATTEALILDLQNAISAIFDYIIGNPTELSGSSV
jgi:[glutamine synthetase] adenylyltransferase / [glutamine synthetase]-adenylyl-L-tyrosine phosphorylase